MKILLVEDDRDLGRLIEAELKTKSYTVDWSQDLQSSKDLLSDTSYDLAIIDLNLPDGQGFDLVKPVTCPVIIMSALSDPENRLKGAELGAIDFIPKPFLMKELLIRIDRVLGEQSAERRRWLIGDVELDLDKRQIKTKEETHLLNKRDFRLLEILSRRYPEVVTRNEIIDYVYGADQNPAPRTVDNAVVGIRQMLQDDGSRWVRSVRGEGYQWLIKDKG